MRAQPLGNNVLVRREAIVKVTPGGIVIADIAQDKGKRGTVLAVGPWISADGSIKVGDTVIIGKYAGLELDDTGPEFAGLLLMQEEDIKMVLSETEGFELVVPPQEG